METADTIYKDRIKAFSALEEKFGTHSGWLSNLRLIRFIVIIAGDIVAYRLHSINFGVIWTSVWSVVFIALVIKHESLLRKLAFCKELTTINNRCRKRLEGKWSDYQDRGDGYADKKHPFTSDLDVFGEASVFQWITAAHTISGQSALARILSSPPENVSDIRERQKAIDELSEMVDWRQNLQATAIGCSVNSDEQLITWMESSDYLIKNNALASVLLILPWIAAVVGIAGIVTGVPVIIVPAYGCMLLLFAAMYSRIFRVFAVFERRAKELLVYSRLVKLLEVQHFCSELLVELRRVFVMNDTNVVSRELKTLSSIASSIEVRYNPLGHFIFNMLFLWDIRCLIRVERWKKRNGGLVRKWISTIGEFEMISSLSQIRFENRNWEFPELREGEPFLNAEGMGHPLITVSKRVCNDYALSSPGNVSILTGSNMSGKSTFLRTVGLNLVLAYAGAPVCAERFSCSRFDLYTSMRVHDDLQNNVSSFYAELLRIKMIVDAIGSGRYVYFLLYELFRGTNSQDRYDGALEVLTMLSTSATGGIISTHDLMLAKLEQQNSQKFKNYHFGELVSSGGISFDYVLRLGPSRTRNALAMMRLIGIPVSGGDSLATDSDKRCRVEDSE